MRRLAQDLRRINPLRVAPSVPVAEAAASIATASAKKAAVSALTESDLTTLNPLLAEKFQELDDRIGALEVP